MSPSGALASTAITVAAVIALAAVPCMAAGAQAATETGFIAFRPERRDPTPDLINALRLPDGFRLVFARRLRNIIARAVLHI